MVFVVFAVSEQAENENDASVVVNGGYESVVIFDVKNGDGALAFDCDLIGMGEQFTEADKIGDLIFQYGLFPSVHRWDAGRVLRGKLLQVAVFNEAHG